MSIALVPRIAGSGAPGAAAPVVASLVFSITGVCQITVELPPRACIDGCRIVSPAGASV